MPVGDPTCFPQQLGPYTAQCQQRCDCGLLTLYRELVVEWADWRESAEQSDDDLAYIARIVAEALGQRCYDARPREAVEQLVAAYEAAKEAGRGR